MIAASAAGTDDGISAGTDDGTSRALGRNLGWSYCAANCESCCYCDCQIRRLETLPVHCSRPLFFFAAESSAQKNEFDSH